MTDGAIFALVWKGTDPEILPVWKTARSDRPAAWHWGLVRFNFREMWAERNDKEIWRVAVARRSEQLHHRRHRRALARRDSATEGLTGLRDGDAGFLALECIQRESRPPSHLLVLMFQ